MICIDYNDKVIKFLTLAWPITSTTVVLYDLVPYDMCHICIKRL